MEIHSIAASVITERKHFIENGGDVSDACFLIDLLLAAHGEGDERLTDTELRDNIVTFLVAGSETTAGVRH